MVYEVRVSRRDDTLNVAIQNALPLALDLDHRHGNGIGGNASHSWFASVAVGGLDGRRYMPEFSQGVNASELPQELWCPWGIEAARGSALLSAEALPPLRMVTEPTYRAHTREPRSYSIFLRSPGVVALNDWVCELSTAGNEKNPPRSVWQSRMPGVAGARLALDP